MMENKKLPTRTVQYGGEQKISGNLKEYGLTSCETWNRQQKPKLWQHRRWNRQRWRNVWKPETIPSGQLWDKK